MFLLLIALTTAVQASSPSSLDGKSWVWQEAEPGWCPTRQVRPSNHRRVLEVLEAYHPDQHARLQALRRADLGAYCAEMAALAGVLERLDQHRQIAERTGDPELLRLHGELQALEISMQPLLRAYRRSRRSVRDTLRAGIEDLAGEIFDQRSAVHERRIAILEQQVVEALAIGAERQAERDTRVATWVDTTLGTRRALRKRLRSRTR